MIVFPMAGLSRRFTEAGYTRPKYMLELGQETVFDRVVSGFSRYYAVERFLFIVRDVMETAEFVRQRCEAHGVSDCEIVTIPGQTAGQAETVALGLDAANTTDNTSLTIFNIDTFRPDFQFPQKPWFETSAGYLEVFTGSGANWSYVKPSGPEKDQVIEVAEKRPISDLCCTGLYHFAKTGDFRSALNKEYALPSSSELYVAPLYNHLIQSGSPIHYEHVSAEDVIFCGVPEEYQALGGPLP